MDFTANAWNLPVGDFEFEPVTGNVYVMHGPSGDIETTIMPFWIYLRELKTAVEEGLKAELEDYEIKGIVLPRFAHMNHWSDFDRMFGPNLNKMYLELEAF